MNLRRISAAVAVLSLLALGGCSSGDAGAAGDDAPKSSDSAIETSDGWVKAAGTDQQMTAVFVTLTNTTDEQVHVVSATTDMSAKAELHERVQKDGTMVMQETSDGFTLAAGETLELKPGGLHVMVMGLQEDVLAGEKHEVTLTLEDGTEVSFEAIAKDFAGANESYEPSDAPHSG